jgi:hypothetical protein
VIRRIVRHAFTIFAAASLLLGVASCAFWARSRSHFELVDLHYARWPQPDEVYGTYLSFSWYSSTLRLELYRDHGVFRGDLADLLEGWRQTRPPGLHGAFVGEPETLLMNGFPLGFRARHYLSHSGPAKGDRWILSVPVWLPTLLSAILPALWFTRLLRARRARRQGRCANCGYDLRATPDRCPECGTPATEGNK